MTDKARIEELSRQHWSGYTGPLLQAAGVDEATLKLCEYLYLASWQHAVKHAVKHAEQDALEVAREAYGNKAVWSGFGKL